MSKTKVIMLAILAGIAVIIINVFAFNTGNKHEETSRSNGVANEETPVTVSKGEEGGSVDIDGVEEDVTVSRLPDNTSSGVAVDEGYYNSTTLSDIEDPDTDYGTMSDMTEENADAMRDRVNNAAGNASDEPAVTADEATQYKNTISAAADKATADNPQVYRSELIALALILGNKGADKENYEYNNYFGLTAKPYDDDAVSVKKESLDGQTYKEIIKGFDSIDTCFDYMSKRLVKAGACSPKTFRQTVKALWNKGYLSEEWQISDFIKYSKMYGGLKEYDDLSGIPYDTDPTSLLRG